MLLQSIKLQNLLSFRDAELELRALNVLIGPNASGKSNLIAAIGLLKAAPENLEAAVQRGGGVREWIHKGSADGIAHIDTRIDLQKGCICQVESCDRRTLSQDERRPSPIDGHPTGTS